jgi:hypothetical protein
MQRMLWICTLLWCTNIIPKARPTHLEVEFRGQFEFTERLQKDCSNVYTTPAARHRTVTNLKTTIIAKELPCRWWIYQRLRSAKHHPIACTHVKQTFRQHMTCELVMFTFNFFFSSTKENFSHVSKFILNNELQSYAYKDRKLPILRIDIWHESPGSMVLGEEACTNCS